MESDLKIAQAASLAPISAVADSLGIRDSEIELYGRHKAKVEPSILERLGDRPVGKYIDVTAITPTPLGEGKTVTTIGLSQGLAQIGKKPICCIRQPSLGPVFGIKGGAAGGGHSQVVPMEDFNLHLTGDMHAVTSAHSLLSAMVDTLLLKGNPGNLDPTRITWRRCVDMNEGSLRDIVIGLNGNGVPRQSGFDLTAASEVMASLALATSLQDLRRRLGRIVVGFTPDDQPVSADDLGAAGAMTALLRDAIKPNLMQTLEKVPTFVHAGPFANIAHGNSSIIADLIATRLGEYVVTESGFGADMGMEKFINIKCRYSGLYPDAVCMVATVRAMKAHSGRFRVIPGRPLDDALGDENVQAVEEGCENLDKHIENVVQLGLPVVVAVNRFPTDTAAEMERVCQRALAAGAQAAVISEVHGRGGEGGVALAEAIVHAAENNHPPQRRFLYELAWPIKKKIETIATQIYGAASVSYERLAEQKIEQFNRIGWDSLPICMAKTQYSLSHDPRRLGRPRNFIMPIREVRASVGAGFLYPLAGEIRTMPALGSKPGAMNIDIDEDGEIVGLF